MGMNSFSVNRSRLRRCQKDVKSTYDDGMFRPLKYAYANGTNMIHRNLICDGNTKYRSSKIMIS